MFSFDKHGPSFLLETLHGIRFTDFWRDPEISTKFLLADITGALKVRFGTLNGF